jgi:hypothetical protein
MTQMPATVAADNLCPLHAEGTICMSCDCSRNGVIVGRPAAARLEFVVRFVEGRIATGAGVDTRVRHVLIVFTSAGSFGALLTKNSKLFCDQKSAQRYRHKILQDLQPLFSTACHS